MVCSNNGRPLLLLIPVCTAPHPKAFHVLASAHPPYPKTMFFAAAWLPNTSLSLKYNAVRRVLRIKLDMDSAFSRMYSKHINGLLCPETTIAFSPAGQIIQVPQFRQSCSFRFPTFQNLLNLGFRGLLSFDRLSVIFFRSVHFGIFCQGRPLPFFCAHALPPLHGPAPAAPQPLHPGPPDKIRVQADSSMK